MSKVASMHTFNCLVKLRMDLPMGSWGKSLQMDWRAASFRSKIFSGHSWYFT